MVLWYCLSMDGVVDSLIWILCGCWWWGGCDMLVLDASWFFHVLLNLVLGKVGCVPVTLVWLWFFN